MVSSEVVKLACVVVMCMAVAAPLSVEAITCSQVTSGLSSCLNYVQKGGSVPPACCSGIKRLNSAAKTKADRQATCNCVKSALRGLPAMSLSRASGLPGKCGVSVPFKVSPSTDCSKVP